MALLNTAAQLYMGTTPVVKAFKGGVQVWPPPVTNTLSASLVKVANQSKVTASAASSGTAVANYKYYLSVGGGAWTHKATQPGASLTIDTSFSSTNQVRVESFDAAGNLLAGPVYTNTVTTDAQPPPPTLQKTVTLSRAEWASYKGNGAQRTDSDGLTYGYSGYYSSTWGNQKSNFRFDIPSDLRNCKSVDKVEVSIYNVHAYNNSGRDVQLAIHHYGDLSANTSGSSGTFTTRTGGKPGWVGGAEWIDITGYVLPNRYWMAEEFRVHGACGVTMNSGPTSSQAYYGYVRNDVRMRFTYTVYT